jgi:hypothetical protein
LGYDLGMSENKKKNKKNPKITDSDKELEPFKILYDEMMEKINPSPQQIRERCEKLIEDSEGVLAGIRIIGLMDHNDCFVFQVADNSLCHSMLTCLGNEYAENVGKAAMGSDDEESVYLCGECQKKAKASQENSEADDEDSFPGLES